ncbi:FAD-dependent oxidoreductase [Streptomyces sp. NPDC057545]|uniref:FAD-dependent oxidoreductase n=1 Tax=Streptomyces sp. NPDC057545 TaxID=3346164 RepID=UPI003688CCC1
MEVLVVGAGPVGLTVAHELRRRGVAVRVVDKAAGPATTSRATATHARTLETYHQMGVLEDLLPRGLRVGHFSMHRGGRMLARLGTDYSELPTRFPFTLQVDQVFTEEVLRNRLAGLGVDVEWNTELTGLRRAGDTGAEVRVRRADGTTEELTVPWLVGTDGAHSRVRKQLGMTLLGDSTETWLVADAMLDVDLPKDSLHWLHTGDGTVLLVPFAAPGKWRLLDTAEVGHAADHAAVAARFSAKIGRALGRPVTVSPPTWVSVFTIQQRMVSHMRAGRCFVAGDAAHVHSPASGQGLNTGVQDGYNLGWKLAQVIRGDAGEELLDSYEAERVPVGATLLSSTRTATALIALRNAAAPVLLPVGLGIVRRVAPLRRRIERKILRGMSGLALHYHDSPLSRSPYGPERALRPGDRVGCSAETERTSPGWGGLCAELTTGHWVLLAFLGAVEDVRAALTRVAEDFRTAVSVRTVSQGTPEDGAGPHPLADPDGALRTGLAAEPGEYVLIRPDGYLAGRGRLTGGGELADALAEFHLRPNARSVQPEEATP